MNYRVTTYRLSFALALGLLVWQTSGCADSKQNPVGSGGVFVPFVQPPKLIEKPTPIYPQMALDFCIEGVVSVSVLVDTTGTVIDVKVAMNSGTFVGFEAAAKVAAWQTRFRPAIQDGKPIEVWSTFDSRFELDEGCDPIECGSWAPYNPPRFIVKVKPIYPRLAQQAGIEGVVFVSVLIDTTGVVIDVKIAKSSGTNAGLEEAAVDAAWKNTFTPALQCGKPIRVWATFDFRFKIRGGG
jgi:TonB family protein